jgi:REP element-mobilizing transposase RayT
MTQPRSALVSLDATPWYHVVSRCVRRAYLCGEDHHTGRNFEHRRGWIVERLHKLAALFAIDVAAYAVMSNHLHIVVRVDAERALAWDRDEVLRRWTTLFTGPELVQRYRAHPEGLCAAELVRVDLWVTTYRERLMDLSWFMRVLNEPIARQANAEDGVTGRFWEGRFKSQALLDEQAVLTAMAYVDLNPIRAKMAETPEASAYTSVAERIAELRRKQDGGAESGPEARAPLMPFDATGRMATAIPFAFDDYLELIDATGRVIREDKRGFIPGRDAADWWSGCRSIRSSSSRPPVGWCSSSAAPLARRRTSPICARRARRVTCGECVRPVHCSRVGRPRKWLRRMRRGSQASGPSRPRLRTAR